jgi:hypothetical protein
MILHILRPGKPLVKKPSFVATLTSMPHFAKRILSGGSSPEFLFNRIFTISGICYHVSVKSISNKNHYFMMHEKNGSWMFSDEGILPQWIRDLGTQLQTAIIEHLQSYPEK